MNEAQELNRYAAAVQWMGLLHANSVATKLEVNRYISASNWRRRI